LNLGAIPYVDLDADRASRSFALQGLGHGLRLVGVEVGDGDRGAFGCEAAGDAFACPPRPR
jgi:hypothetical protein